jgi:hypothetical protein
MREFTFWIGAFRRNMIRVVTPGQVCLEDMIETSVEHAAARLRETRQRVHQVTRFGDSTVWSPRDPARYRAALALPVRP